MQRIPFRGTSVAEQCKAILFHLRQMREAIRARPVLEEIRFHHLAAYRRGHRAAAAGGFLHYGDRDLRVFQRCDRDEPGVRFLAFLPFRGAGFSAHADSLYSGAATRSARMVHHRIHAIHKRLMRFQGHVPITDLHRFIAPDNLSIWRAEFLHEMRTVHALPRRNGTGHHRFLERSHKLTLTYREVQNKTARPPPSEAFIPGVEARRIRKPSGAFPGNIHSELGTEAETFPEFVDFLHAEDKAQLVHLDIAGKPDCVHKVQAAVLSPAFLIPRAELIAAGTRLRHMRMSVYNFVFKARARRDQFEHGPWRIDPGNGPVRKRAHGIQRDFSPAFIALTALQGKDVRIETRGTHHRQNFTVPRIYSDNRPAHGIRQSDLRSLLDFQIQSRHHLIPGDGGLDAHAVDEAELAPVRVDLNELHAILSAEFLIIFLFKSFLADPVPEQIILEFRLRQLFFRDFARITEHMRGERPVRIFTAGFHFRHHSRKIRGAFLDDGDLLRRGIFKNAHRSAPVPAAVLERGIPSAQKADHHGILVFQILRHKSYLIRRAVPH